MSYISDISTVEIRAFARRFLTQSWVPDARMGDFEAEYDRHSELNRENRLARQQRDARRRIERASKIDQSARIAKTDDQEKAERQRKFREEARTVNDMVHRRVTVGRTFDAGYVGGTTQYWRDRFAVDGHLPSEGSAIRKRLVASIAAKVRSGPSKGRLCETPRRLKALALDDEYVEGNRIMRSIIRVDIDAAFKSVGELQKSIESCGVRMPNFIVGWKRRHDGCIYNPHLIWLIQDAVNFGPSGRPKCQRYFGIVGKMLTEALLPIGADPGGLANPLRFKNPLCPRWYTVCSCETAYTLDELSEGLARPTKKTSPRRAVGIDEIQFKKSSNALFESVRTYAWQRCNEFKIRDDLTGFDQAIDQFAESVSERCGYTLDKAAQVASKVVLWTWKHFDPLKVKRLENAQRPCSPKTIGKSKREAHAIGGQYSCQLRASKSVQKLTTAYEVMKSVAIKEPSCRDMAEFAGLSISTAEKYRKEIASKPAVNIDPEPLYIVKKVSSWTAGQAIPEAFHNPENTGPFITMENGPMPTCSLPIDHSRQSTIPGIQFGEATHSRSENQANLNNICQKTSMILHNDQCNPVVTATKDFMGALPEVYNSPMIRKADSPFSRLDRLPISVIDQAFREFRCPLPSQDMAFLIAMLDQAYQDESDTMFAIAYEIACLIKELEDHDTKTAPPISDQFMRIPESPIHPLPIAMDASTSLARPTLEYPHGSLRE